MTAALLVAVYLAVLAGFLGLDIITRVPPTLYAAVLAGLGALAGVGVVAAMQAGARSADGPAHILAVIAAALAGGAVGGGLAAVGRVVQRPGRAQAKERERKAAS